MAQAGRNDPGSAFYVGDAIRNSYGLRPNPGPVPNGAPGPLSPPKPGWVRMRSIDRKLNVTLRLDVDPPAMTPQLPRIEQVDIPFRASRSWWSGQAAGELVIPCLLDGFPRDSIEDAIDRLEQMGVPIAAGSASKAPAPLQIAGNVPGVDRLWMLTGLEPGDAIWQPGYRVRQHYSMTLTQWLPLERADTSGRRNPRDAKGKRKRRPDVKVRRGENLATIAADVLGSANRWRAIAQLNPYGTGKHTRKRTSPDDVKPGETLKMPQG
jgi:hypothetical protein